MKHLRSPDLRRQRMIERDLKGRGIRDERVLAAMAKLPREEFLPPHLADEAYADEALPLGPEQTLSQPYIVALMLESLKLEPGMRVLEVGSGSGYVLAVLAETGCEAFGVELDSGLTERSKSLLARLGYANAHLRCGDGFAGWPEEAPFDAILVSAAPESIPRELVRQLRIGGRMALPLGRERQVLVLLESTPNGLLSTDLANVRFVPLREGGDFGSH